MQGGPAVSDDEDELERARAELSALSKNELVSLCHQVGAKSAHKGMTPAALVDLLEGGPEIESDPVDEYRREVMKFIASREGRIVMACHGDCFRHSGAKVIQCYDIVTKGREDS